MAIAVLFSLTIVSAGFAALRTLGLAKGAVSLGLAPPAGLAVLAIVSTWSVRLGAPPPVAGIAVLGVAIAGLALAVVDRGSILNASRSLAREQRLAVLTLVTALAIPGVVMSIAFAGAQVPLSPHDGAFHTETIQAYRLGRVPDDWYPPGLAALFGAWLQLLPGLDSAQGAFDLGLALPLLAGLGVFGLGVAVWRDLHIAAAGALFLSLTYLFPFFPELWSGWPLAMNLILVMGVWTVGLEYLRRPGARWGIVAGLGLGAIALVHGTEVLTLGLVLPVLLLARLRQAPWRELPRDLGLATVVAVAGAAVYLPTLLHWAAGGGAYAVGLEDGQAAVDAATSSIRSGSADLFVVFALGALGIDLPIRVVLLAIGAVWAFRQRSGRSVVAIGVLFAAVAAMFTYFSRFPAIHELYALTFPWAMHYRLFMLVAMAQALLAGAGLVVALRFAGRWTGSRTAWARRSGRALRLLIVTWLGLVTWGMALFVGYPAHLVLGFADDDALAMRWLRQNATHGTVVVNDGYADAGIWAPYKADVQVLLPRGVPFTEPGRAALIVDHVAGLDRSSEAAAAACTLNVAYVYRGAHASEWDRRRFPALADMRASPALQEVFSSGEAAVFKVRLPCQATQ